MAIIKTLLLQDALGLGCRKIIIWTLLLVLACIDNTLAADASGVTITVSSGGTEVDSTKIFIVTKDDDVKLKCAATGAKATEGYLFKKNGKDLGSWEDATGSGFAEKTLSTFSKDEAAEYTCQARGSDDTPVDSAGPQEKATVTLNCGSDGTVCTNGIENAECYETGNGNSDKYCRCQHGGVFATCPAEFVPASVKITGPDAAKVGSIYRFDKGATGQDLTCAATGATHYRIYKVGASPVPDFKHWDDVIANNKETIVFDKTAALGEYVCEAKDSDNPVHKKTSDPITVTWECKTGTANCAVDNHAECHATNNASGDKYCQCKYGGLFGATSCHACKKAAGGATGPDPGCTNPDMPQCKDDGSACEKKSTAPPPTPAPTVASGGTTAGKGSDTTSSAGTVTSTACLVIVSVVVALMI